MWQNCRKTPRDVVRDKYSGQIRPLQIASVTDYRHELLRSQRATVLCVSVRTHSKAEEVLPPIADGPAMCGLPPSRPLAFLRQSDRRHAMAEARDSRTRSLALTGRHAPACRARWSQIAGDRNRDE